jgi:glutamate dehydrogenase (NADP+)
VAQYTVQKVTELGGKCVTLSDSAGFVHDPDGIDEERLDYVMNLKNRRRGRIKEYAETFRSATYHEGARPWKVPCDCAFPSATQNEVDAEDAELLVKNGCLLVSEGANMPTAPDAVDVFLNNKVLYGLGKAANAGGVAVSGLEMAQNSQHVTWTREEVDSRLRDIMKTIHDTARRVAEECGSPGNYVVGANVAGFRKVADAMLDQGLV